MHVGRLGRIVLLVADWQSSVEFYERLLGTAPKVLHHGWAVFEVGGTLLCLRGPWDGMEYDPRDFGRSPDELLFLVDDLARSSEDLRAAGHAVGPSHSPGPGLRVAELADPDGRRIGLEERNPVPGPGTSPG